VCTLPLVYLLTRTSLPGQFASAMNQRILIRCFVAAQIRNVEGGCTTTVSVMTF
jgi:hypothetical protein